MTTLRAMTPADYPAVADISRAAAERALVGLPFWESEAEIAAALRTMRNAAFIVAESAEGQVVGLGGYELAVDGEARMYGPLVTAAGHGIGAWLSARIESLARQEGAHAYTMLIGLNNKAGQAWAEWRGYQLDSEHPEMLFTWVYPGDLQRYVLTPGGTVRRAAFDDLDQIYALYQECFPPGQLSRQVWGTWLSESWVLEEDGEILALMRLEEHTRFLHHVCVRPDRRHRGLGARLVSEAIEQHWRAAGRSRIGLTVRLDNTAAVSLFRRLGFTREIPVARFMKRES